MLVKRLMRPRIDKRRVSLSSQRWSLPSALVFYPCVFGSFCVCFAYFADSSRIGFCWGFYFWGIILDLVLGRSVLLLLHYGVYFINSFCSYCSFCMRTCMRIGTVHSQPNATTYWYLVISLLVPTLGATVQTQTKSFPSGSSYQWTICPEFQNFICSIQKVAR